MHKYTFTADIEQAFLQISLNPTDRDAVRFLWFDEMPKSSDTLKPRILRLTRVIFGAKPSPFLLSATIKHHIQKYKSEFPEAFDMLNECLYVDDLISGVDEERKGLEMSANIKQLLIDASFNMRKWKSNSKELQKRFNEEYSSLKVSDEDKVLGYRWNSSEDTLGLEMRGFLEKDGMKLNATTKREVLKMIGRLYDPIGFLNPFIVTAKILMQETWKTGIGWDDKLPDELLKKWRVWCNQIQNIGRFKISRHYSIGSCKSELRDIQLHCFTDASAKAVIYLRYRNPKNQILTSFVI